MIREKVSDILDVPIRSGRWMTYAEAFDRDGKFTRKVMLDIIMSLCEGMEQLEFANSRLQTRIEFLEPEPESPETVDIPASESKVDDNPETLEDVNNKSLDVVDAEVKRKEALKAQRIANLAKAREARKLKNAPASN